MFPLGNIWQTSQPNLRSPCDQSEQLGEFANRGNNYVGILPKLPTALLRFVVRSNRNRGSGSHLFLNDDMHRKFGGNMVATTVPETCQVHACE